MQIKKWLAVTGVTLLCGLLLLGGITAWIDPLFHYHKPLDGWAYTLAYQRYVTDGILRNWDYDAIIIGSSMTEQFKASQVDKLFDRNTVKVPLSGASYKEVNDRLERAFQSNNNIKLIVRCLDFDKIASPKDDMRYDSYPEYLYDDNLFNDVEYLFNKDILIDYTMHDVEMTAMGLSTSNFDDYCMWDECAYGKEAVLSIYERTEQQDEVPFTFQDEEKVSENIYQNVIELAEENPQTDFYIFFSPYSIVRLDRFAREGKLQYQFDAEKYATALLLQYDNIHVFSFWDQYDLICNLDNYKDTVHYGSWVNDWIIDCMATEEHRLSNENYEDYYLNIEEYYTSYDFDAIFDE